MIQLGDDFIDEVGLSALSRDERHSLLTHIYSELEIRVGTELTRGLTSAQLDEFEAIIDGDLEAVAAVLDQLGDVEQDRDVSDLCEEAARLWLSQHRPDYPQVVRQQFERIKAEVKASAARLVSTN